MKVNLKLACILITASAGLFILSFVSMEFVSKLAGLLITASVVSSAVFIWVLISEFMHFHTSKKKKDEVIILEKHINEDEDLDKIVIDVGGTDAFLSVSAEELLRKLSIKRQKSSLLYNRNKRRLACQNMLI